MLPRWSWHGPGREFRRFCDPARHLSPLRERCAQHGPARVEHRTGIDPYMQEELEALLRMQALLGGSAIVMTATLPLAMRKSYVEAFQGGLATATGELSGRRYPGLHVVGRTVESPPVEALLESVRSVRTTRLSKKDDAMALLSERAAKGAACVWICNAVDDAIDHVFSKPLAAAKQEISIIHVSPASFWAVSFLTFVFGLCRAKHLSHHGQHAATARPFRPGPGQALSGPICSSAHCREATAYARRQLPPLWRPHVVPTIFRAQYR